MPIISEKLLRSWPRSITRDFIFEPKLDGFRALAHVRGHRCELVSRNGHTFRQWPQLAEEIAMRFARTLRCSTGGIWCLNPDGRTHFKKLLYWRECLHFDAFDVLSIEVEGCRSSNASA